MLIHTLSISLHHVQSLLSLLYLHWLLPGNGFQCCNFLSFSIHVLTGQQLSQNSFIAPTDEPPGWQPCHTNPLLVSLPSQDSCNYSCSSLHTLIMDCIESTSPKSSSIVASRSYRTDCMENTASQLLHCCVLWICCLAMGVFAELCPSNGCLWWLHSSCLEQICHNMFLWYIFWEVC
jgi:hypothetical protein